MKSCYIHSKYKEYNYFFDLVTFFMFFNASLNSETSVFEFKDKASLNSKTSVFEFQDNADYYSTILLDQLKGDPIRDPMAELLAMSSS